MRVFFRSFAVVVLALSLIASLTWAGTASNVASLVENPDSYQSQVVRVTGTVYNHRIRRGVNKCFQLFTLEDETGSINAVYKANCSGARNTLRDRDVVTVEAQFERTSSDSGMLKVRSILSKVAPSAQ
jgi:cytochrome c-type biogenesis protein CcmE